MICLTAPPRSSALARASQMRLHELSLRAHIGMEFGQENPRGGAGNRLSRASGQPELWGERVWYYGDLSAKSGIYERLASRSAIWQG